jgi:hypothetical protein
MILMLMSSWQANSIRSTTFWLSAMNTLSGDVQLGSECDYYNGDHSLQSLGNYTCQKPFTSHCRSHM